MKIKRLISQHRRDFRAIYICQHCEHEVEGTGYDDTNFHVNVIPNMVCEDCGRAGEEITSEPSVPAHWTL